MSREDIENVAAEFAPVLRPSGAAFLRRIYADGLEPYQRRLAAVGFTSGGSLLDAGCGFGQWSLAAATYRNVTGVDISPMRIAVCQSLARHLKYDNSVFLEGSLHSLPFPNATFDAAISYSALYFTDFERSIAELGRVLRPGAKLYISTNDIGRFLMDVVENKNSTADFNVRLYGIATLARTMIERITRLRAFPGTVAMSEARTLGALARHGFKILESGPEGTLGRGDTPMQRGRYGWFTAVFDVLACRL